METEDISRLFLTSLLSMAPDAIIAVDDEHCISLFNDGAENIFGYRRNAVLGQPLNLLLPERFRTAHTDHIHEFGAAPETARLMGKRGRIFARHKDGREFPAEAAICKFTIGQQRSYSVLLRDVTERERQKTHARLLTHELEHRVHNILARIRMVVERSTNEGISLQEFREALLDRINSLARAHGPLGRTKWHGVTVGELITDQLEPYVASHNHHIEGKDPAPRRARTARRRLHRCLAGDRAQCRCGPGPVDGHELTTNALKYGALSVPDGRVTVSWRREATQKSGEELLLQWTEQGGPEVQLPQRVGYGTILIRELLTFEFDGTVDLRYPIEGLTCQISLPLDRVLENAE